MKTKNYFNLPYWKIVSALLVIIIFNIGISKKLNAQNGCFPAFTYTTNGSTVTFTNTSNLIYPWYYYSWSFGDGQSSSQANPVHTYSSGGPMVVCMTISHPPTCTSMVCDTLFITPNDIKEIKNIESLNTYPNPCKESTKISFVLKKDSQIEITLMDILGNEVEKINFNNEIKAAGKHEINFNTENIDNGVYVIRVKSSNSTTIVKLIKQ